MKIGILISILCIFAVMSCDDMNDLHIDYLNEGETVFAAMVDSISPGGGNNRINLEIFVYTQRIDYIRIYWNAYHDSMDYKIDNPKGVFNVMVGSLPESEYLFQVVSFDKYGNRSLPFECTASSFGENYRSTLPNRRISSITKNSEGVAVINWVAISSEVLSTTVNYRKADGTSASVEVKPDVEKSEISDYTLGSDFTVFTSYRPAINSPDVFNSNSMTYTFPE